MTAKLSKSVLFGSIAAVTFVEFERDYVTLPSICECKRIEVNFAGSSQQLYIVHVLVPDAHGVSLPSKADDATASHGMRQRALSSATFLSMAYT